MHTTDPKRKRHRSYLWQDEATLLPKREEEKIPPCTVTAQPGGDCQSSDNEKSLYLELPVSANGHFAYNSSSQVHKIASFPLFLWTCVVLHYPVCPEIQFFVILKHTHFAGEISCCLFKVNRFICCFHVLTLS